MYVNHHQPTPIIKPGFRALFALINKLQGLKENRKKKCHIIMIIRIMAHVLRVLKKERFKWSKRNVD